MIVNNLEFKKKLFSNSLIRWYKKNKRDLPWRKTRDPYKIWLSEIILQQTRIVTGSPYYERFIEKYPNVMLLASSSEDEVLKMWEGLGYYSRARNLHKTAKIIVEEFDSIFPSNYETLIKLPGIGDYTASAISSFSINEINPVVDGNVYRFLSRLIGLNTPINTAKSLKIFKKISRDLISKNNPSDYNQAIMDFGSTICKPVSPLCLSCLYNDKCYARINQKVNELPVKKSILKLKNRYLNFIVFISDSKKVLIEKRMKKDIWKNLYQFPSFESNGKMSLSNAVNQTVIKYPDIKGHKLTLYKENGDQHRLTHQNIFCFFWVKRVSNSSKNFVEIKKINQYPFPKPLLNFIKNYKW